MTLLSLLPDIAIGLLSGLALFIIIDEITSYFVFGRLLGEDELDKLLGDGYKDLKPRYGGDFLSTDDVSLFIAHLQMPLSFSSGWYIVDMGRIPRWSKWHRKLNFKAR